jgi:hypothetical protein
MEKQHKPYYYYNADEPRRLTRLDKLLYATTAMLVAALSYLAVHYR